MIAVFIAALISGTFALQHGEAKATPHLSYSQIGSSVLDEHLDIWLTDSQANVLTRYRVDMTKYLHLIIISDDFRSFAHVHPKLEPDGHFLIDHHFPHPGLYHVYSDAEPGALGQQVFRYDVAIGSSQPGTRALVRSGTSVDVDGYRVTLATTHLRVGEDSRIAVHITKANRPATDLHPYLGALAHAVFIRADDLSYTHVHPMAIDASRTGDGDMAGMGDMADMGDMPGMDMPALPDNARSASAMLLDVRVAKPGLYKLWLQFRGGGGLHVATFVLGA